MKKVLISLILIIFSVTFILSGCSSGNIGTSQTSNPPSLVSKTFDDFSIYCRNDSTNLQKKDYFDTHFKGNYVEWSGVVSSISDSFGLLTLQVKHCPQSFVSDIIINMKDGQKNELLKYKEGDTITYRARMTRIGDILGMFADEGEILSTPNQISLTTTTTMMPTTTTYTTATSTTTIIISPTGSVIIGDGPYKFSPNVQKQTQEGVSLALVNYSFVKKGDDWGILENITLIIDNQGVNALIPSVTVQIIDPFVELSKMPSNTIDTSQYLDRGQYMVITVPVELSFTKIKNEKNLRISIGEGGPYLNTQAVFYSG